MHRTISQPVDVTDLPAEPTFTVRIYSEVKSKAIWLGFAVGPTWEDSPGAWGHALAIKVAPAGAQVRAPRIPAFRGPRPSAWGHRPAAPPAEATAPPAPASTNRARPPSRPTYPIAGSVPSALPCRHLRFSNAGQSFTSSLIRGIVFPLDQSAHDFGLKAAYSFSHLINPHIGA
ncbi:hypothetical protein PtA15_18A223 [Puccinia triticina]|uniref:DOMON domain-containing protein n=1 Tax=Puccinia triticina TaxID=208348 RepID=A0ABY7D8D1_9BASI|nr:uncharacterized protein PtA15_18A223 [Puccinia triticina]WAQ93165.1 hypothetical protein PtA15_18A223 [Puccinia triticina]WAR63143.1 hypothetical protein PtB15_18B225 [Puccinia triticina]